MEYQSALTKDCSPIFEEESEEIETDKPEKTTPDPGPSTRGSELMTCRLCSVSVSYYKINAHIRKRHMTADRFQCSHCYRLFNRRDHTIRHMDRMHYKHLIAAQKLENKNKNINNNNNNNSNDKIEELANVQIGSAGTEMAGTEIAGTESKIVPDLPDYGTTSDTGVNINNNNNNTNDNNNKMATIGRIVKKKPIRIKMTSREMYIEMRDQCFGELGRKWPVSTTILGENEARNGSSSSSSNRSAVFKSEKSKNEMNQSTTVKEELCFECDTPVKTDDKARHVRTVHFREPIYACSECPREFRERNLAAGHIRSEHGIDNAVPKNCRENIVEYRRRYVLCFGKRPNNRPGESANGSDRKLRPKCKCLKCGQIVSSHALGKHILTLKHSPPSYKCPVCEARFPVARPARMHADKEHQSRADPIYCGPDAKTMAKLRTEFFGVNQALIAAEDDNIENNNSFVDCESDADCNEAVQFLDTETALLDHNTNNTSTATANIFNGADLQIDMPKTKKKKKQKNGGDGSAEQPVQKPRKIEETFPGFVTCHVCQTLMAKGGRLKHVKRHHMVPDRFQCPECFKLFTRKETGHAHLEKLHRVDREGLIQLKSPQNTKQLYDEMITRCFFAAAAGDKLKLPGRES